LPGIIEKMNSSLKKETNINVNIELINSDNYSSEFLISGYDPTQNKITLDVGDIKSYNELLERLGHELIHYLQNASGFYKEDITIIKPKNLDYIFSDEFGNELDLRFIKLPNLEFDSYLYSFSILPALRDRSPFLIFEGAEELISSSENFAKSMFKSLTNDNKLYEEASLIASYMIRRSFISNITSAFLQQFFPYHVASKYGVEELPKDLVGSLRAYIPKVIKYRELLAKELDKYKEEKIFDLIYTYEKYGEADSMFNFLHKLKTGGERLDKFVRIVMYSTDYLRKRNLEILDLKNEYIEKMSSFLYKKRK
jgi:hypothetical protein